MQQQGDVITSSTLVNFCAKNNQPELALDGFRRIQQQSDAHGQTSASALTSGSVLGKDGDSGCTEHPRECVDVAIIGAGIAGLACAARLQKEAPGLNFIILEASDRVGGRAMLAEVGGYAVDVGAGWVHGVQGNPLFEDGVLTVNDTIECSSSNIWINGPGPHDSTNFGPSAEDKDRWLARLRRASEAADTDSWLKALKGEEEWTVADERFFRAFELWFGASAEQLCAIEWSPGSPVGDFPGPHAVVRGGMSTIADRLLQKVRSDALRLETLVEEIVESEAGVEMWCAIKDGSRQLVSAQWVVCTVPLGALQRSCPSVQPPLPEKVQRALNCLEMSSYLKCFIVVEEKVAAALPTWIWTDHPLLPMAFNYFPVKGYPIIVCTSISSELEHLSDAAVVEQAMIATSTHPSQLQSFHVTRWCSAKGFYGAYSFSSSRCDFTETDAFFDAMQHRRLIFAGEHTHEEYQGAVHGAYLSGKKAADDVRAKAALVPSVPKSA